MSLYLVWTVCLAQVHCYLGPLTLNFLSSQEELFDQEASPHSGDFILTTSALWICSKLTTGQGGLTCSSPSGLDLLDEVLLLLVLEIWLLTTLKIANIYLLCILVYGSL